MSVGLVITAVGMSFGSRPTPPFGEVVVKSDRPFSDVAVGVDGGRRRLDRLECPVLKRKRGRTSCVERYVATVGGQR